MMSSRMPRTITLKHFGNFFGDEPVLGGTAWPEAKPGGRGRSCADQGVALTGSSDQIDQAEQAPS
jgi:hypothetical protein